MLPSVRGHCYNGIKSACKPLTRTGVSARSELYHQLRPCAFLLLESWSRSRFNASWRR